MTLKIEKRYTNGARKTLRTSDRYASALMRNIDREDFDAGLVGSWVINIVSR